MRLIKKWIEIMINKLIDHQFLDRALSELRY